MRTMLLGLGAGAMFLGASAAWADEGVSLLAQPTLETAALDQAAGTAKPSAAESARSNSAVNPNAKFTCSNKRWHDDPEVFWPGFLNGLRGFEQFYNPIGNPIYFETPFNNTGARFLYLHHTFDENTPLAGGHADIFALQARVALTERLGFIAVKDGYTLLRDTALGDSDGWNDIAAGLKYAFYVDRENELVATGGLRYQFRAGDGGVLQGFTHELSPFVSFAKGWNSIHFLGDLGVRVPLSSDDGNTSFYWDLHGDFEIFPEALPGFAPVFELHGLHYLTDGSRFALPIGGLDYTQLGSNDVAGTGVVWAGVGARWKFTPHVSVGCTYERALTSTSGDLMKDRVTVDVELTW